MPSDEPNRFAGVATMVPQARPLLEAWAEMPAFRSPHGTRHPLGALLALAWSAMRCGSRSDTAIAEWGRHDGAQLGQACGFTPRSPCAATFPTLFRRVDRQAVAAPRGAGAEGLLGEAPRTDGGEAALAIAGKTLRGRQQPGAPCSAPRA